MKSILLLALFSLSCAPAAEKKLAVAQGPQKTENAKNTKRMGTARVALKSPKKILSILPQRLRSSEGFYVGIGQVSKEDKEYKTIVFEISHFEIETKEITFSMYVFGEKTSFKLPFTADENGVEVQSETFHFQLLEDGNQHFIKAERVRSIFQDGTNSFYQTSAFSYDPKNKISIIDPVFNETNTEWVTESANLNASSMLFTPKDVENASAIELRVMRLGIYARHGAAFTDHKMSDFFSNNDWYLPISTKPAVEKDFSEIEKKNIKLIRRYEKHAEHYYEEFGR